MSKLTRAITMGTIAFMGTAALVLNQGVAPYVQKARNAVRVPPPYHASPEAQALHGTLRVADMHTDSLLWRRDLNLRSDIGHVDVPRLIDAGVAVQAFTVVTKTPRGQNYDHNSADSDNITLLAVAQAWPAATWFSLLARARYQAKLLGEFADGSEGRLHIVTDQAALRSFLSDRAKHPRQVAALLGLEGGHALEGDLANVDVLFEDGFRMMAPVHFFDNALGGSAHGVEQGGLTDFGRAVIKRQEQLGVLVDLAHASPALIDDALAIATRPLVVSHSGVRGTCDNSRNLSDKHIDGIAATGGLIGIGLWQTATCGTDAAATARAIKYVADRVGVEHVTLGSDFDGAVTPPFDVTGLPLLTQALLESGFTQDQVRLIMGENLLAFLGAQLPPGRASRPHP